MSALTAGLYECYCCGIEGPEPACDSCRQAMDAFGAVQCVFCEAYWSSAFDGEWEFPCAQCHPAYRLAYTVRLPAAPVTAVTAVAPVTAAAANTAPVPDEDGDVDMGWYEAKKKEWAAYSDQLEAEEEEEDD